MTDPKLPLGQASAYPNKYEPALLFPIARSESRIAYVSGQLPFDGIDIWNAWELTWLGPGDLPVVATAQVKFPANTPNLIESKSLKLYLNSFAMSSFDGPDAVAMTIAKDLGNAAGDPVTVRVDPVSNTESNAVSQLPGQCLDALQVNCDRWEVDASLLKSNAEQRVEEELHTHLLRSLCPVTGQPDNGSLAIYYQGPKIDKEGLLRYIVSFRQHNDFHEACIERIFVDLLQRCAPEKLSLHARFQRRGGIDINPFRSNCKNDAANLRLWRQ